MASAVNIHLQQRYPPSKLQALGRNLYSQSRYEEAIEAFTALIQISTGKPACSVLALRAAAYEKSNDVSSALKDGKRMIELDPENAQGYLITAHLLHQLENDALALKIYQRGLRYCKSPADREKMQLKMSKLSRDTKTTPSTDPVQKLPPELVEMVFKRLDFAALCICLKVSTVWRDRLAGHTSLWTSINLSLATKTVRPADLISLVERSQKRLQDILLVCVPLQNSRLLESITRKSPLLRSLRLLSGGELSDSLLRALSHTPNLEILELLGNVAITNQVARAAVAACPNLVELRLGGVEYVRGSGKEIVPERDRLRVLVVHSVTKSPVWDCVGSIVKPGDGLKNLTIKVPSSQRAGFLDTNVLSKFKKLEVLELWGITLMQQESNEELLLASASTLRSIRFFRLSGLDSLEMWLLQRGEPSQFFPRLEHLSVTGCSYAQDLIMCMLDAGSCKAPKALDSLSLDAGSLDAREVESLLANPRLLGTTNMQIKDCRALRDVHVPILTKHAPRVEHLGLPGSQISGVGVQQLVQTLKCLKRLDLTDCLDVGVDAVQWARKQGISVTFQLRQGI